jgi:hypothetical protein
MQPTLLEALAAYTRETVDGYDHWDTMTQFLILHWEDGKLAASTAGAFAPDVREDQYGPFMIKIAADQYHTEPDRPACAYLLQTEGWTVTLPPEATDEDRRRLQEAVAAGELDRLPDAVESADAWCADLHGRVWHACQVRGAASVRERYWRPGTAPRAHLTDMLLVLGQATSMPLRGERPPGWQGS